MATGTYIKTANVTASMALPFVGANATYPSAVQIDPQVYYDYADDQIEALARSLGVATSSIDFDDDGNLSDVNLREWGVLQLYIKLYSDKMLTTNQDDYTQDKYRIAVEECTKSAAVFYGRITADSIAGNLASGMDARIRSFHIRRAS